MSDEAQSLLMLLLLIFSAVGVFVVTIAIIFNYMEQYETKTKNKS